ncbi:MAG: methionyl-tRNA formyltransferase [Planctomycetota bacterium]
MTILFLGSGPFGLPALRRLQQLRPRQIVVGTVPDAPGGRRRKPVPTPVKVTAAELALPCFELPTLRREHADPLLQEVQPQLAIVCDFRLFLTRRFLAAIPQQSYNLHPSLLPRYRGAAPVARSILANETEHGITLYQMVKEMDAGPIVGHRELPITTKQDRVQLEAALSEMGADLLAEHLPSLESGNPDVTPQDHSQATFAPIIRKPEGWIDWRAPASDIENQVLAMTPWPRSFCRWLPPGDGEPVLLFVDRVAVETTEHSPTKPGTILSCSGDGIAVACGSSGTEVLVLKQLQRAGKRLLEADEFLRGTPMQVGQRLQSDLPNDDTPTNQEQGPR